MRISAILISAFIFFQAPIYAQQNAVCGTWDLETGADLALADSLAFSICQQSEALVKDAEVVFCPAGIKRSSADDIKKRMRFDWVVKYNNIYLRSVEGVVFEGMNEHGFSASLLFHQGNILSGKEKHNIPIGASLAVNFFIDHFKCIDTALLAVWDIRIFDDMDLECDWPFRIVLHDSTGSSAYVEYVNGKREVYTDDGPSFIVGGPNFSRLVTLKHLPDYLPDGKAEELYVHLIGTGYPPNADLLLLQYYMHHFSTESYYTILRYPLSAELNFMIPGGDEARFDLHVIEFKPGKEVSTRFF
jgi:penicillin V acylase-like amidase (Ntn superfamily)